MPGPGKPSPAPAKFALPDPAVNTVPPVALITPSATRGAKPKLPTSMRAKLLINRTRYGPAVAGATEFDPKTWTFPLITNGTFAAVANAGSEIVIEVPLGIALI